MVNGMATDKEHHANPFEDVTEGDGVIADQSQNGALGTAKNGVDTSVRIAIPGAKWLTTAKAGEAGRWAIAGVVAKDDVIVRLHLKGVAVPTDAVPTHVTHDKEESRRTLAEEIIHADHAFASPDLAAVKAKAPDGFEKPVIRTASYFAPPAEESPPSKAELAAAERQHADEVKGHGKRGR